MCFNFITKPDFIAYGIDSMPSKVVEKFRKKGLVIGWTVKNEKDLEIAKKYCDNYIFEDENKWMKYYNYVTNEKNAKNACNHCISVV